MNFLKKWLLHSLILWLLINLSSFVNHLYKVYVLKLYYINTGTGAVVKNDLSYRIISLNYYQATPLLILAVLLLIEINAYYLVRRNLIIFALGSLITGFSGACLLLLYKYFQGDYRFITIYQPALVIAAYAFAYPILLNFFQKRIIRAERLYEHSRAEVNALKSQVHPHFLFNTLNSLYGTAMREHASLTADGIGQLSHLMRYVMNETLMDFVPLANELRFVEEYIELQRIRLPSPNNRMITINIQYDDDLATIAPLLLIPFIENSFKYGVSIEHESYINLHILIRDSILEMTLRNSIVQQSGGAGTGVENVTRRLQLLYPGKHTLEISSINKEFLVMLRIQLL